MPDIKDSVGEGGTNNVHDVALVQGMLRVVKNAKNAPYLGVDYTGTYGPDTKTAISNFQTDRRLQEKAGFIGKGSITWNKLVAALPLDYKTIRIIENTKTVYLEMDTAAAAASAAAITGKADLDVTFRGKVAKLVNELHQRHKIALSIPASGWRRDFAAQAALNPATTRAGPGESNHQYGQAVDIGFNNLRWVKGDGAIEKDDWWLNKLNKVSAAKAQAFWNARNAIAFDPKGLALFPTGFAGDLIHIQAYNDAGVSYGRSLAKLLNLVAANGMSWEHAGGNPNTYKSNLMIGVSRFPVGNARQIWAAKAPLAPADIAQAINEKLAADPAFDVFKFFGAAPPPAPAPAKIWKEVDIAPGFVTKLQTALKADFQAADKNWQKWKPVK